MDVKTLFQSFNSVENNQDTIKFEEFLARLLAIKNPMHFSDKMGTDEEIEELIAYMKERDMTKTTILKMKQQLKAATPKKSSTAIFI